LEIMVVVALAALLLSVTPPLISRVMPGVELKSAARNVASGLRLARAQAIRTHEETTLTMDVEDCWFRISGRPKKVELPEAIELRLVTAERELLDGRLGAIRFFPDGGSTGGRVTLSHGKRGFEIGVDWLTGRVDLVALPPL
jgi:general secretion pathway protein H